MAKPTGMLSEESCNFPQTSSVLKRPSLTFAGGRRARAALLPLCISLPGPPPNFGSYDGPGPPLPAGMPIREWAGEKKPPQHRGTEVGHPMGKWQPGGARSPKAISRSLESQTS